MYDVGRRQQRVKSYSRIIGGSAIGATLGLLLLDILSPPGPPLSTLIGAVVYGGKAALGALVAIFGVYALFRARLPILFRVSVLLYVGIVLCWFLIWLMGVRNVHTANSSIITYLLNPTYSIWSWLLILLVPIVAKWNVNGQISNALRRIPLTIGLAFMLVPAMGMWLLHWNLNASNGGVFMLFLLALRHSPSHGTKIGHFVIAAIACAAMLAAGYRIYAIGALIFSFNLYFPKRKKLIIAQILFISMTPIIYHFLIINYSYIIVSSENSLLFDTRSFLFKEIVEDFSLIEFWTGRGLDASYYSPYFLYVARHMGTSVGFNNIWRTTSEIGWLNIILHFGIQGLLPFYIATITPVMSHSRRLSAFLPIDGLYCFLPMMTLLFAGELWNAINVSYWSWYIALGILLTNGPMPVMVNDLGRVDKVDSQTP